MTVSSQLSTSRIVNTTEYISLIESHIISTSAIYNQALVARATINSETDNWEPVIDILTRLGMEHKQAQIFKRQTKKIQDTEHEILRTLAISLDNQIKRCYTSAACPIFKQMVGAQLDNIRDLMAEFKEKLNIYRTLKGDDSKNEVCALLQEIKHRVIFVRSLPQRCHITFSGSEQTAINHIDALLKRLQPQLDPSAQGSIARTVHFVHSVCAQGMPSDQIEREFLIHQLRDEIEKLPRETQDSLNRWTHKLSISLKKGQSQDQFDLYENLAILETALCNAVRDTTENALRGKKRLLRDLPLSEFYRALHVTALGPDHVDPVAWAKRELPFLYDLVPLALYNVRKKHYTEIG